MNDKIIVTNRGRIVAKYSERGWNRIKHAIDALIGADRLRGISSRLVCMDLRTDMYSIGAEPLKFANDPQENKNAIDAIFNSFSPDYLLILGATDVIPQQDLKNLADINDSIVWSDLPYACDASYSQDPTVFVGPTRVVGRLPDLVGANDPAHLIKLLNTATHYKEKDNRQYTTYFAISAKVWETSSRYNLSQIFDRDTSSLLLSSPAGPRFAAKQLRPLSHFINCHGNSLEPMFYGEDEEGMPEAMSTALIEGRISEGTVVAAECCYGAQMYDSFAVGVDIPICQSYLQQGAYAFWGATTIAYGLEVENGAADLICRNFLRNIQLGASIGRAALLARQDYVFGVEHMDPIDLKTLSQFTLLGDPSIQPIMTSGDSRATGLDIANTERFARRERRERLLGRGDYLASSTPIASRRIPRSRISTAVVSSLRRIVFEEKGRVVPHFDVFEVVNNRESLTRRQNHPPLWYYTGVATEVAKHGHLMKSFAIVARVRGDKIMEHRIYES